MKFKKIITHGATITALALSASTIATAASWWRCTAFNGAHTRHWSSVRAVRPNAVSAALARCRANVVHPRRCNIRPELNCAQTFSPVDHRRCIVMDHHGRLWKVVGRRPCVRALNKCSAWHLRNGIIRGSCQVVVR